MVRFLIFQVSEVGEPDAHPDYWVINNSGIFLEYSRITLRCKLTVYTEC